MNAILTAVQNIVHVDSLKDQWTITVIYWGQGIQRRDDISLEVSRALLTSSTWWGMRDLRNRFVDEIVARAPREMNLLAQNVIVPQWFMG